MLFERGVRGVHEVRGAPASAVLHDDPERLLRTEAAEVPHHVGVAALLGGSNGG